MAYTRNCEQQHTIAVVKSTLRNTSKTQWHHTNHHKGAKFKGPMRYFISYQHVNKGLDPNIHVIDGMYNIKGISTLHVLAANYPNKHVTFNKGQCIGHVEPPIDHMPQTFINSLTTQMMIDELFNLTLSHLPYIPSQVMWGNHSINCWRH